MGTTNILDLNNRVSDLEKAVSGGDSAQANKKDIATEFSATTAYTAGCFVYYQGKLYQFNTDHAAGAWDSTDVVEANVTDQIVSNKSAIDGLTASDVAYDNTTSGLTATKVQEAIDEVVQTMGNAKITKLWENPDPTQNMVSDTDITIDDTNCDLIAYICFLAANNNKTIPLVLAPTNSDVYACYADANPKQRRFDRSTGKVTVKTGFSGGTADDSVIILYQIYGIQL